jgi:hypothetical protein
MPTSQERVVVLRIDEGAVPIAGSVNDANGASHSFSGWLGLARALEVVLGPEMPPGPDGPAAEGRLGADRERLDG